MILIYSMENLDNVFNACDKQELKDENEIYIALNTFKLENTIQKLDQVFYRVSLNIYSICQPTTVDYGYKVKQCTNYKHKIQNKSKQ